MALFEKLPDKKLRAEEWRLRVIFFDPSVFVGKIKINPYARAQSIPVRTFFPSVNGKCGCGCGKSIKGRQRQWATDECAFFAWAIRNIICGRLDSISMHLSLYYGWHCLLCEKSSNLKIDHIIPVKHGGGGCWLSNYQILCHAHHVSKTRKDFNWKKPIEKIEMPKLFAE